MAGATTNADLDRLRAKGVPQTVIDTGLVYVGPVLFDGATFQHHPDSDTRAVIIPVRQPAAGIECLRPAASIRFADTVDIIACTRDRVALRRGVADVLGCVGPQVLDPEPVPIWKTPLAWLRAGGEGLCLLTTDQERQRDVLLGLRTIEAEDTQHGRQIEKTLRRPYSGLPRVLVAVRAEAVA